MTKKQPITNEMVMAPVRASEAQAQNLGKVSPQRFKLMIEAAVGELCLAQQMVKVPPASVQPAESLMIV